MTGAVFLVFTLKADTINHSTFSLLFFPVVVFRIFPELSSTDMVVIIVKGMNLPAPSGKNLHLSVFPVFFVFPPKDVFIQNLKIFISAIKQEDEQG